MSIEQQIDELLAQIKEIKREYHLKLAPLYDRLDALEAERAQAAAPDVAIGQQRRITPELCVKYPFMIGWGEVITIESISYVDGRGNDKYLAARVREGHFAATWEIEIIHEMEIVA